MSDLRTHTALLAALVLLITGGCRKGELEPNTPPESYLSLEAINLSGENRLNSLVTLNWWGTDADGVVTGYEISLDQENWTYTTNQDSTFLFSINAGSDTIDVDLYVRAVDNEGERDETPAYLRIPLKNTPPEVVFNQDLAPVDTAFNVLTLVWEASDLDGIQTLEGVELRLNDGAWTTLPPNISQVTIVPDDPKAVGETSAQIFYDVNEVGPSIEGLQLNESNDVYVRVFDIANSISEEDTISDVFVRNQTNDLLVIGANASSPDAFYASSLSDLGVTFDFIDFVREDAKNQPRIWSPTFRLMMEQYEAVLLYANEVSFTNVQTNAQDIVLEFASDAIQGYVDGGGKMMISSSFPGNFNPDSPLIGILPLDSFSTSEGQARLPIDSLVTPTLADYPTLRCASFISGLDPFYPSSDATVLYNAQLTRSNEWVGPTHVAATRSQGGNVSFVFFSVELHRLNADPAAMNDLFESIFIDEFNL